MFCFAVSGEDVIEIADPSELLSYVARADNKFSCTICGKIGQRKDDLRDHVENIHFPDKFVYVCECGKELKSKTSLKHHKKSHSNSYY